MTRRSTLVRIFALCWTSLAVALPAVSAVADGRLAAEGAGSAATHVESTTSSTCPVVHPPDCALCRYLSGSSLGNAVAPARLIVADAMLGHAWAAQRARAVANVLPDGRAPPTA